MKVFSKIKNIIRGLKQGYGSKKLKQDLWNGEYATGRWDLKKRTEGDPVYRFIHQHSNGGGILELGCGTGNTGEELLSKSYSSYVGVDISDVAIEAARERAKGSGRSDKNVYEVGDILLFQPTGPFNVILIREAIYYILIAKLKGVLQRLDEQLEKNGVFIVTVIDRDGYAKWLNVIKANYDVIEEFLDYSESKGEIIVFRKRPSRI